MKITRVRIRYYDIRAWRVHSRAPPTGEQFALWAKLNSAKFLCQYKVWALSEIFIQRKFCAIQYIIVTQKKAASQSNDRVNVHIMSARSGPIKIIPCRFLKLQAKSYLLNRLWGHRISDCKINTGIQQGKGRQYVWPQSSPWESTVQVLKYPV